MLTQTQPSMIKILFLVCKHRLCDHLKFSGIYEFVEGLCYFSGRISRLARVFSGVSLHVCRLCNCKTIYHYNALTSFT